MNSIHVLAGHGATPGGVAGGIAVALLIAGCVAIYFLPALVAFRLHHHNAGAIFVVDFFLGWTLIGWVVALAMALSKPPPAPLPPPPPPNMNYQPWR